MQLPGFSVANTRDIQKSRSPSPRAYLSLGIPTRWKPTQRNFWLENRYMLHLLSNGDRLSVAFSPLCLSVEEDDSPHSVRPSLAVGLPHFLCSLSYTLRVMSPPVQPITPYTNHPDTKPAQICRNYTPLCPRVVANFASDSSSP